MTRLNSILLVTLLVLVLYSLPSSIGARKILKMETKEVPSLKGTLPLKVINYPTHGSGRHVARLANNERVLVSANPSPGAGH